jgi:hypothetical protein
MFPEKMAIRFGAKKGTKKTPNKGRLELPKYCGEEISRNLS